jgi:hypothetical protein
MRPFSRGRCHLSHLVVIKTMSNYNKPDIKHQKIRVVTCMSSDNIDYPVAFFDGAAQGDGRCCGAGGIIKFSASLTYKWYMNCGQGTNTKAELMGAWATLHIAKYLDIEKLQVYGDSLVIINWLSNKGNLRVCALEGWKRRITILKENSMI